MDRTVRRHGADSSRTIPFSAFQYRAAVSGSHNVRKYASVALALRSLNCEKRLSS
jgi:hypothetical protein